MNVINGAQLASTQVYHDSNSLSALKAKGKDNNPEAIREAAKQFESIFMGMMLKSMRDANAAIVDEPMFDSASMGTYKEMYDEQLTLHLTGTGSGLGLTDILVQQLSGIPTPSSKSTASEATSFNPTRVNRALSSITPLAIDDKDRQKIEKNTNVSKSAVADTDTERGIDFSSPNAFVHSLWPYAEKAAKALNLDPKILIAQAALETGWGRYVMRPEQGTSSKNLFGIKTSKDWQGSTTNINSVELVSGTLQKQSSEFRTYDSYDESFSDYADFISNKSRYQKAVSVAEKPENYVNELQTAGYATDPDYAKKINDIFNSKTLNNAVAAINVNSDY